MKLTGDERRHLHELIRTGKRSAQLLMKARIATIDELEAKSPNGVSPALTSPNKSRAEPDFIGGQNRSLRIN